MNRGNKNNDPYSFEQTHGGRDEFPGGDWGRSSEFGKYSSLENQQTLDEKIRKEVCEALLKNPNVDDSGIEVSVQEGHVTLAGTVENNDAKQEAQKCIDHLPEVACVHNKLQSSSGRQ